MKGVTPPTPYKDDKALYKGIQNAEEDWYLKVPLTNGVRNFDKLPQPIKDAKKNYTFGNTNYF